MDPEVWRVTLMAKIRAIAAMSIADALAEELIFSLVRSATGKLGGRPRKDAAEPAISSDGEPVESSNNHLKEVSGDVSPTPPSDLSSSSGSLFPVSEPPKSDRVVREIEPTDFRDWYAAYPKKEGRKPALVKWKATAKSRPPLEKMLATLDWQKRTQKWKDGFILNPATYLHQERWNDEQRSSPASSGATLRSVVAKDCEYHQRPNTAGKANYFHEETCSECRHVKAARRHPSHSEPMDLGAIAAEARK